MRTIVLIGLLAAAQASAGEVYKCKGPNGEVTFTNIACPKNSESKHYGSYTPAADAPPAYAAPPQQVGGAAPVADAPPRAPQDAAPAIAGYQCSVNSQTWVQTGPCPSTSTRLVREDVQFGDGYVERQETVPVQQQALSKDAMCSQLAARANTSEKGPNSSDASYARNRMRGELSCG